MTDRLPLLLSDSVIGLRRPEPCDAPGFMKMRNDLVAIGQLISYSRGVSFAKINEWIHSLADNQQELVFTTVLVGEEQRPIGFIKVFDMNTTSGSCRLGMALFDAAADGRKGHGGRMLRLLLDYISNWLRIRKVTLEVLDDNLPAIQVYRRCGFVEEGRLHDQYYIDGRYRTVVIMSKFLQREEYLHDNRQG